MISTHFAGPLKLDLRPSRLLCSGFALISLCCLWLLPSLQPALASYGASALQSRWLVLAMQGLLVAYAGGVLYQLRRGERMGRASLRLAAGGWRHVSGGAERPIVVEFSCVSRFLVVLSIEGQGRHWRLPVLADQLDVEHFRALRRVALHGRSGI